MNLLLLEDGDFLADGTARVTGPRLEHVLSVLRTADGETLRVGRTGGLLGTGRVLEQTTDHLLLEVSLTEPPPPRPGIDLLLAMPRPKALNRILPAVASLGIDRLVLLNAARVEKSYFDSKLLDPGRVASLFAAGLSQARDTIPPELLVRRRLRPFVEDELDGLFDQGRRLLCHPAGSTTLPAMAAEERAVLAIGPDGGWVPFELDLLVAQGFSPVSLGPRTLRVEVAIPTLVGALRTC